jgi:hypothetical protein
MRRVEMTPHGTMRLNSCDNLRYRGHRGRKLRPSISLQDVEVLMLHSIGQVTFGLLHLEPSA